MLKKFPPQPYFEISLRDLHFHAFHGVEAQERIVGQEYTVNLMVKIPRWENPGMDCLDDTISYAEIYKEVEEEMEMSAKLLETVCFSIACRLKARWEQIESGWIEIIKHAPPIPGIDGNAAVRYVF